MKNKKIALLFICLNPPYHPYVKDVIEDCNKYFLTNRMDGHKVDYFLWTDLPEGTNYEATVFPTDPAPWPTPTLMRYHLFLQQEEIFKEYDYIFYMDADMRVVAPIDNEILGEGLTAAQHPMYALKQNYLSPFEPNPKSTAYIHRPQYYFAGGFQGGRSKDFIKAMEVMKKNIDKDFVNNYSARWNDESHWNKYLFDHPPAIILNPSYIYPDSLINEYYVPLWGQNYQPKIITLTKPFSLKKLTPEEQRQIGLTPKTDPSTLVCPTCGDVLSMPDHNLIKVMECKGKNQPHQVESRPV